jgi:hypothetical protein
MDGLERLGFSGRLVIMGDAAPTARPGCVQQGRADKSLPSGELFDGEVPPEAFVVTKGGDAALGRNAGHREHGDLAGGIAITPYGSRIFRVASPRGSALHGAGSIFCGDFTTQEQALPVTVVPQRAPSLEGHLTARGAATRLVFASGHLLVDSNPKRRQRAREKLSAHLERWLVAESLAEVFFWLTVSRSGVSSRASGG